MTDYAKRYLSAGAPKTITHGEYKGTLVDIQPLLDGLVCGIYRFPGGDCIGGPTIHRSELMQEERSHDKT